MESVAISTRRSTLTPMCGTLVAATMPDMSTTDYLLDSALVLLVLLQIRWRPLTNRSLLRPVVIVAIAVASYLKGIPTAGNDVVLVVALTLLGATIGAASGVTASLRRGPDGAVELRSGWISGFFWVLGMGSRFAFIYWLTHSGASDIASFSAQHSITSGEAWTAALLAMAVAEVLSRTGVLAARRAQRRELPALTIA